MTDAPGALAGLRILVVDDDEDSLEAVASLLQMNGAEVRCCLGARQAREVLSTFRADLLISDLSMPGEDGFDLIVAVRRLSADRGGAMPAIAFSGNADARAPAHALECGFQQFLPKPVDVSLLLSTVAALARRGTR